MRIGFLVFVLLLLTTLVLPSCFGDKNLALDGKATPGKQPDSSLLLKSPDDENEISLSTSEAEDTSTIYKWDDEVFDWVEIGELERRHHPSNVESPEIDFTAPFKIEWEELMNILYQLKYYPELDLSVFAPVFGPKLKKLDGQTVIMEGYILPVDEEKGLWALSAFPVASCFFCGQASPASVISVYFRDENRRRRYATGDQLSLQGELMLNHDDPVELYYVLKEAEGRIIQ